MGRWSLEIHRDDHEDMPARYEQPRPDDVACARLARRIGPLHLAQRLGIERDHAVEVFGHGRWMHPENWLSGQRLGRLFCRLSGLDLIGRPLARRHRVVVNEVVIPSLPAAAEGLRVLHLTDLHLDMAEDTVEALIRGLQGLEVDLAVLTGDFRARTYGPFDRVAEAFERLRPHLPEACYAVLGNHDCLALGLAIEAAGVELLLNEAVEAPVGGLYIAGIDDPHYYRLHNIERALSAIPADAAIVLLSHSPEVYRQVAHTPADLMLCGHTHGGQVCLPGGLAMTYDCPCPRRYCQGAWRHADLQGYTSRGCGTSVLDIRFFCPPEITVHRLTRG